MKKIIALIPARMASTRCPGKPLIDICGKSMIEHVWQRVIMNKIVSDAYIATCDSEIINAAEKFGAKAIMTSNKHQRGSDRIAEGCAKLLNSGNDFDVAINVQGDEPLLNPRSLDILIEPFIKDNNVKCANLIEGLEGEKEINNYNNVKVVFDKNNFALYFSRLPIPNGVKNRHYKQLGIYGFTKEMILKYPEMKQMPLEIAESDDMLRFIEHGIPLKVVLSPYKTIGLDTPEDHRKICKLMETDELFQVYRKR